MIGSNACSIYRTLGLNREIVKVIYRRFQSERSKQVVFGSIVCATRFKMYNPQGILQPVKCFICGGTDSFSHLLECTGVGKAPASKELAVVVPFLLSMIKSAARNAPIWPVPIYREVFDEISLADLNSTGVLSLPDASSVHSDSLSFEIDSMLGASET